MTRMILPSACLLMILLSTQLKAQVQLDWAQIYAGSSLPYGQTIAADNSGNVWVTGTVGANTTQNVFIMKYTAAGVQTGPIIFSSAGLLQDTPNDIATDASGNVYVAGTTASTLPNSSTTTRDIFIVKYNSAGTLLWSAMFSTPGVTLSIDEVTSIAVDPSGNVYIGGQVVKNTAFEYDFLTIKYSAAGAYQWHQLYNGPGNAADLIVDLAADASGNVYVTGSSVGAGPGGMDYATIKYNTAGVQQWVARYAATANSGDQPTALAIDGAGNVYVTGASGVSCTTVKYNNAGVQQWVAAFQGPAGNARGADIYVDGAGNVYVGGSVTNAAGDQDMLVIKYNAAGVQQWWTSYDTGTGYSEFVIKAGMDGAGNFYVTGLSSKPGVTFSEIVTAKYTSSGTRAWVVRYGAATAGADSPHDMVIYTPRSLPGVIKNAFIYITGPTNTFGLTLKYSQPSVVGGGMAAAAASSAKNATSTFSIDNTPNPFTAATIITYQLPEAGKVSLNVFDAMGRKVSTLVEATRAAGVYQQRFDRGELSDGVYYCQYVVESNGQQFTKTQALVLRK